MTRPRGFIDWRPQQRTLELLEAVQTVLEEYVEQLPLTIRQVFYRLVGRGLIDKTEKGYNRLVEHIGNARRARMIDMGAIRDDGMAGALLTGWGYESPKAWIAGLVSRAEAYQRDRQGGQEPRLIVWCEAGGMVPQLERVAEPYGISVVSSGGFDSLTVKHRAGLLLGGDEPVEVLHIGDWDPSGECMFDALAEDIQAFAEAYCHDLTFSRLAVTPEQVEQYDLPTVPPKSGKNGKENSHQLRKQMTATVQAEALDPAVLARTLEEAIQSRFDMDVYEQVIAQEAKEREELKARLIQMTA